ncbi:hypothetical protein TNCV_4143331 [Trichonephila clavipes]|nr:hypothetical protein TNCV_4143331 [Trichonephila clavipes]
MLPGALSIRMCRANYSKVLGPFVEDYLTTGLPQPLELFEKCTFECRRNKYVSNKSKNGLKEISLKLTAFNAIFDFIASKLGRLKNCVEFLSKEMPDIKIDDNGLLQEYY